MKTDDRGHPTDEHPPAPEHLGEGPGESTGRPHRRDLLAASAGAALVTAAALVGTAIQRSDGSLRVNWPPLLGTWDPRVGPGTPAALAVAVLVVAYGPGLAARLPWRALLVTTFAAALAWTFSLALVDGWHWGVARRLTTKNEYLTVIDRFSDIGATLRGFSDHIVIGEPGNWPAHVAGHPPGATLTFVWLDRIGLGGGSWAGVWCVVIGGSAVAAVLVTLRALTDERTARRAAPFLALAPAAVWMGTSADGYFAGVAAWSLALLTLAATRKVRLPVAAALGAGLLYGFTCYLSYGLTLMALPGLGVLVLARTARPLPPVLLGTLAVPVAFTLAGFNWWEAYQELVVRYYQGAGGMRPYTYWIWANLAATTLAVGLATAAGLGRVLTLAPRAVREMRPARPPAASTPAPRLAFLVLAALLAIAAADLSGMSKAETERIWLPFMLWLIPATALLPGRRRGWLAGQALVALLVNHLVFTGW
ncbi:membrane protein [Streptomyces camponoticapitis]|uniref:Membrane protein n=1 Tax=Streptomyces camponoticapitis TaxID=1616125 RepID=A0ABQ2DYW6_9ACTN|nr:membrane protein [Streptomyces camponoticapitis]